MFKFMDFLSFLSFARILSSHHEQKLVDSSKNQQQIHLKLLQRKQFKKQEKQFAISLEMKLQTKLMEFCHTVPKTTTPTK